MEIICKSSPEQLIPYQPYQPFKSQSYEPYQPYRYEPYYVGKAVEAFFIPEFYHPSRRFSGPDMQPPAFRYDVPLSPVLHPRRSRYPHSRYRSKSPSLTRSPHYHSQEPAFTYHPGSRPQFYFEPQFTRRSYSHGRSHSLTKMESVQSPSSSYHRYREVSRSRHSLSPPRGLRESRPLLRREVSFPRYKEAETSPFKETVFMTSIEPPHSGYSNRESSLSRNRESRRPNRHGSPCVIRVDSPRHGPRDHAQRRRESPHHRRRESPHNYRRESPHHRRRESPHHRRRESPHHKLHRESSPHCKGPSNSSRRDSSNIQRRSSLNDRDTHQSYREMSPRRKSSLTRQADSLKRPCDPIPRNNEMHQNGYKDTRPHPKEDNLNRPVENIHQHHKENYQNERKGSLTKHQEQARLNTNHNEVPLVYEVSPNISNHIRSDKQKKLPKMNNPDNWPWEKFNANGIDMRQSGMMYKELNRPRGDPMINSIPLKSREAFYFEGKGPNGHHIEVIVEFYIKHAKVVGPVKNRRNDILEPD